MFTNSFSFWQSHMNKDHEEDTKAIVHNITSIPVSNTIQFYEIWLSLVLFFFDRRSHYTNIFIYITIKL